MLRNWSRNLRPDTLVLLGLAVWTVLNLAQAALTGLANDEVYYWYFAQSPAWGYFDHPPMVAWLVWLSQWAGGALGVRLCCTLLQPLYLLLFWHTMRPAQPTRRQAMTYVAVAFSIPLLQLYGFLAVPDAPLMFFSVLFLWSFKRFAERPDLPRAAVMGMAAAALGYSKYQALLVVVFAVLANPRLLRRWQLYAAGAIAVALYVPHLIWQWQHDWVSFQYHLVGRSRAFKFSYTTEFLLNLLLIFNPLWLVHFWRAVPRAWRSQQPLHRALVAIGVGFPLFFLLSTLRGYAQPQWVLPAALPAVWAVTGAADSVSARGHSYIKVVCIVSAALFIVVRVLAVANPMHLKGQIWGNRETYGAIAQLADGRPVLFCGTYTAPAKYRYYTGGEASAQAFYFGRQSQWMYDTTARAFAGREVMVCNFSERQANKTELPDGSTLRYGYIQHFVPVNEVVVEPLEPLNLAVPVVNDSVAKFELPLRITNPYPFAIAPTPTDTMRLRLYTHVANGVTQAFIYKFTDTIPPRSSRVVRCVMAPPRRLHQGTMRAAFSLGYTSVSSAQVSPECHLTVERQGDNLIIQQLP